VVLFHLLPVNIKVFYHDNYFQNMMVGNVIGLAVSFYFFYIGGSEKYSRCITKDQIKIQK
jgi:hypothetical protein